MNDLTVLFLTLNRTPKRFAKAQWDQLRAATQSEILTISREPMPGWNLLDTDEPGYLNIYRQMLRGAKEAKTEYIAMAEDDCFYPEDHFDLRPKLIGYNQHRFALFTWGEPLFHWRNRFSNATLISNREHLIDCLEERFAKWGDKWPKQFIGEVGRERVDKGLGVSHTPAETLYSYNAVIQVNHELANEDRQRRRRKSYGPIKAWKIPYWGTGDTIQRLWG